MASKKNDKGRGTGPAEKEAVDQKLVEALRDMTGAPPRRCEEALRLHNGNADSAAMWLLLEGNGGGGGEAEAAPAPAPAPAAAPSAAAPSAAAPACGPTPSSSSSSAGGKGSKAEAAPAAPPPAPAIPLYADRLGFDGTEMMGVVRDTPPGKPYGFIQVWHQNVTLFYHYNDVVAASREAVKRHTPVAFQAASWSQGFKAERVRALTTAEQRTGIKDTRMNLLKASVKKWNASARSGVLQLDGHPCSLQFQAQPALASHLSVGAAVVCKVEGKGKDLAAVHIQLPPDEAKLERAAAAAAAAAATAAPAAGASATTARGRRR